MNRGALIYGVSLPLVWPARSAGCPFGQRPHAPPPTCRLFHSKASRAEYKCLGGVWRHAESVAPMGAMPLPESINTLSKKSFHFVIEKVCHAHLAALGW